VCSGRYFFYSFDAKRYKSWGVQADRPRGRTTIVRPTPFHPPRDNTVTVPLSRLDYCFPRSTFLQTKGGWACDDLEGKFSFPIWNRITSPPLSYPLCLCCCSTLWKAALTPLIFNPFVSQPIFFPALGLPGITDFSKVMTRGGLPCVHAQHTTSELRELDWTARGVSEGVRTAAAPRCLHHKVYHAHCARSLHQPRDAYPRTLAAISCVSAHVVARTPDVQVQ
jgi:hypothetical protein